MDAAHMLRTREVRNSVGIAHARVMEVRTVRILIDGLEHSLTNMGDVAMLQVAVARLRRCWPDVSIDAIVDAPERLKRYCPGVRPIAWRGYRTWLSENRMQSVRDFTDVCLSWTRSRLSRVGIENSACVAGAESLARRGETEAAQTR